MPLQNCLGTIVHWDDLRISLALARQRTLAAAARNLHVAESTVSRRLVSPQSGMGARLLQRTADGYTLTLAGKRFWSTWKAWSVARSPRSAQSGDTTRAWLGVVRVSSSQLIASHLLAPCFATLNAHNRHIMVELLPPCSAGGSQYMTPTSSFSFSRSRIR
jgi:DNA-binding transcriptional LysR family regulator